MGWAEIQLQSFSTSELFGSEWSFLCACRFTFGDSAPGTHQIWGRVGPMDGKIPWLSSPWVKRLGMKKRQPTRTNISREFYGKLGDWPKVLSVVNVKFLTYVCTTASDIEPRTFQYLLRVTYTLVISGSESGHFTEVMSKSRRKWQPTLITQSSSRRRCRSNDSARYSRRVTLGSSTGGK